MKYLKFLSLIWTLFLVIVTTAHAEPNAKLNPNSIYALRYAKMISKVKNPKDLLKLPLNSKNLKYATDDLKLNKNYKISKLVVTQPTQTQIKINLNGENFTLDFHEFHKKNLYLNGKKIVFSKNKTYQNFKMEIEQILGTKTKTTLLSLILPTVHASPMGLRAAHLFTTIITSMYNDHNNKVGINTSPNLLDKTNLNVTMILLNTYERVKENWREYNQRKNYGPDKYFALTDFFECENNKLKSVYEVVLASNGKGGNLISQNKGTILTFENNKLQFKENIGHIYNACQAEISSEGVIQSFSRKAKGFCYDFHEGDSIYEKTPFFRFPKIAKQCCEKAGCYEKVKSKVEEIQQSFLPKPENKKKGAK